MAVGPIFFSWKFLFLNEVTGWKFEPQAFVTERIKIKQLSCPLNHLTRERDVGHLQHGCLAFMAFKRSRNFHENGQEPPQGIIALVKFQ